MLSAFVYAHTHTHLKDHTQTQPALWKYCTWCYHIPYNIYQWSVTCLAMQGTSPVHSSSPRHKSNLLSVLAADNGKAIGREINAQNIRSALCSNAALNRKTSDAASSWSVSSGFWSEKWTLPHPWEQERDLLRRRLLSSALLIKSSCHL